MISKRLTKVALAGAIILLSITQAHAIIIVAWGTSEGFWRPGGEEPLLGTNRPYRALAQLIFTPSGTVYPVDPGAPGYVSGDNVLWKSVILDDQITSDDWGSFLTMYTGAYVAGWMFMRVFDAGSHTGIHVGMWYFDTPLTQTWDNTTFPPIPDVLDFGPMTEAFGDVLDKQVIPEPATWAMMLLGATALVGRKLLRK